MFYHSSTSGVKVFLSSSGGTARRWEKIPQRSTSLIWAQSFDGFQEGNSVFSNLISTDPSLHTPHVRLRSDMFPSPALGSADARSRNKLELSCHDFQQIGFFYVDKLHSVIYMANYSTRSPELRCQEIKTGPIFKAMRLVCEYEDNREFYCEGFEISSNGRFPALLYCSSIMEVEREVKHRYDINVWELADIFNFEGQSCKAWCRMVKSSTFERPFEGCSPQPLIFDSTNKIYSPWTLMDIDTLVFGLGTDTNDANVSEITKHNPHLRSICFSPDRRFAIGFDCQQSRIIKYLREDMSLHSVVSIAARSTMMYCVSYSGRFIVWQDMSCEKYSCYLQDFVSKTCTCIPRGEDISFPAHINLKFTWNEDCLIGCMGNLINRDSHYVSLWRLLPGYVQQTKSVLIRHSRASSYEH